MNTPAQKVYTTQDAVAFLNGTAPDAAGRTVEDYLNFDMDTWEACHNHVQWAFPSHISSMFNPDAPIVDMDVLRITLSPTGYRNVELLMVNYLDSLGFTCWLDNHVYQFLWDEYSPRNNIWLSPNNHNYLRITRLLNLLSYTNPEMAVNLLAKFLHIAQRMAIFQTADGKLIINVETVVYWSKAAIGNL